MIAALKERMLPGGGLTSRPGGAYRCDSTAWGLIALEAHGEPANALDPSRLKLSSSQTADGSVPVGSDHPGSVWPTPLAALAWLGSDAAAASRQKAIDYLIGSSGLHWEPTPDSPLGHDTAIPGWAWTLGAHSFVEPTTLSVLALSRAGLGGHERVSQGVALLMDRQLSKGGWNYGNTTVFDNELEALPSTTGMALTALAGRVSRDDIGRSLDSLHAEVARIRTPLSLGWGLAALDGFGERPDDADEWVEQTLARQAVVGPFETSELALLLLAAAPETARRQVLGVAA